MSEQVKQRKVNRAWYLLLLLPFIAAGLPATYAKASPTLWGFPFFYWYQMLWIILTAIISYIVYVATRDE